MTTPRGRGGGGLIKWTLVDWYGTKSNNATAFRKAGIRENLAWKRRNLRCARELTVGRHYELPIKIRERNVGIGSWELLQWVRGTNLIRKIVNSQCTIDVPKAGGETATLMSYVYYCFRAISTIRGKARRLNLMKIERDRFAFERMPNDLAIESWLASGERIMPMTAQLVEF